MGDGEWKRSRVSELKSKRLIVETVVFWRTVRAERYTLDEPACSLQVRSKQAHPKLRVGPS